MTIIFLIQLLKTEDTNLLNIGQRIFFGTYQKDFFSQFWAVKTEMCKKIITNVT